MSESFRSTRKRGRKSFRFVEIWSGLIADRLRQDSTRCPREPRASEGTRIDGRNQRPDSERRTVLCSSRSRSLSRHGTRSIAAVREPPLVVILVIRRHRIPVELGTSRDNGGADGRRGRIFAFEILMPKSIEGQVWCLSVWIFAISTHGQRVSAACCFQFGQIFGITYRARRKSLTLKTSVPIIPAVQRSGQIVDSQIRQ